MRHEDLRDADGFTYARVLFDEPETDDDRQTSPSPNIKQLTLSESMSHLSEQ